MAGGGTCEFIKPGGERCRARPRTGRPFCFAHDPDSRRERDAARRAGGRVRSRRAAVLPGAPDVAFASVADVTGLLAATASQVRRGDLDCRLGNCLCYIAATALKALQQGDLEQRLSAIEAQLAAGQDGRIS
jgi:hypothetical protein